LLYTIIFFGTVVCSTTTYQRHIVFFQYSMQRRRDHIRAPPTYSVFHRPLRPHIHGRQLESRRYCATPEHRPRHRSPPPIRGHRSRSPISNHRDEYTHRSAHREEQRTISRTHVFRRDSPSDNLKTNRRGRSASFPLMHVHATIPLPRSILQLHPNHLWRLHTTTRLHLRYRCRRHVLRHPTWNLTTRSQHVFLPHQSCQIHNSSPTQLSSYKTFPPHTVSKPAKVYNCTSCKRTLTSASGWYKHRRFFHGLQTPDKYLIFVLQPHRQPIQTLDLRSIQWLSHQF
jgi:hypothetical protein